MNVVVVESPAKAKTINKYLGSDFVVLASYGHVRDLPSKDGSVRPDEDFAMDYQVDMKSTKHMKAIADAVKKADHLYLATDPDREGEAIAWHVLKVLEERKALKSTQVHRIAFNEITKRAVGESIRSPRDVDMDLVNAQQARRALDYLVGFNLSPVLWRKLPGARSAGRVQSVALRLVCERELEIEAFKPQEYWSVEGDFTTPAGDALTARLTHLEGAKLDKFTLSGEEAAEAARASVERGAFSVRDVEKKPARRNPSPPFTTSTLQQEASRKLGFSASRTMQVAQKLYEGIDAGGETTGFITYMRTDGVQIAGEALEACRDTIAAQYGREYLPGKPRVYETKSKNAQEAHEAIRPTDPARRPEDVKSVLSDEQFRLYELIWKRTLASQMESAQLERTTIDLADSAGNVLRATGSVVRFPGFLKLYEEGRDDSRGDESGAAILPAVESGQPMSQTEIRADQHFTEPPPRYSEATLVKKLEELGIGRPSTYASILSVLQDRDYVRLENKRFIPEDKGRLVTAFLTSFFARYVGYDFTAQLEEKLDDITEAKIDWKEVLRDFWTEFRAAVENTKDLRVGDVLEELNRILGPHIFEDDGSGRDPRTCPACEDGRLSLKIGRFGAFVGCSNYPDCRYTRQFSDSAKDRDGQAAQEGPVELGLDPESGLAVTLRKGPYGHYLQLGEREGKEKPKRATIPKDMPLDEITLELALKLLALPREVGPHPESGKTIRAGLGRYGPYVECDGVYGRLSSTSEALTVGLNRAVDALATAGNRRGKSTAQPLRTLGEHPDGGEIVVKSGRYGPYVSHDGVNATLPKDKTPEDVTLEDAIALLAERIQKMGGKKPGKRGTKSNSGGKRKAKSSGRKAKAPSDALPPQSG